jgi:chromosome segregation ATPase
MDEKVEQDKSEQLKEEVKKALGKEPEQIPQDHQRNDEGPSLVVLNKEVDAMVTEAKYIQEIEKDWDEVQRVFSGGDPLLANFKEKYETIYNALKESYDNEIKQMKKCKEYNSELVVSIAKTQTTQKMAQDYADTVIIMKQEIINNVSLIEKTKKKETELKEKINGIKDEILDINKQMEKGVLEIQSESEKTIAELKRLKDDFTINQEKLLSKLSELRTKTEYAMRDKTSQEEENFKNVSEINRLREQIAQIEVDIAKEESRKKNMETDMDLTKKLIDESTDDKQKKVDLVNENVKQIELLKDSVLAKSKEKEKIHEQVHTKKSVSKAAEKEKEKQADHLSNLSRYIEDQKEEYIKRKQEAIDLERTFEKIQKEFKIYDSKRVQIKVKRKDVEGDKGFAEQEVEILEGELEDKSKDQKKVEDDIDVVFKKREEIARDIKGAEDEEHETDGELIELQNNLKKLENHVRGYKSEAQKLNKIINLLEKEQEKYGIDASQAHAKYYQTLEELKIKNNLINDLQKKNSELEAKLKHQQNLYEAVRSDRNLYSKNLLQAQEEIGELTKKYTRMYHQVDQLKDELKLKDASLVDQDREFQKIVKENEKTKIEKVRVKTMIKTTEDVIKNQEEQISRLKYIITEAHSEKGRQQKDYEMVVNERDILGAQLIKRNQELSTLYEKIKIAQSNLAKGESYFRERQNEFESLKANLVSLRKELESAKEQTESIEDLRQEINSLHKDLLTQKTKVRALQDELEIPMNVHRWRKVEATDQENYERILKIQTLQRRLIAKTEEVNEKDQLIKEKEKLYMELKNILARQPGVEIQQQLATYKDNLKEKSAQMKKMLEELKQAQDQVNLYKFEIERLKEEMGEHRKAYFKRRAEEDKMRSNEVSAVYNTPQIAIPYAYTGAAKAYSGDGGLVIGGHSNTNPMQN